MSDDKLRTCPKCRQDKLIRLIGAGSAAIVKGTKTPCRGGRKLKNNNRDNELPPWRDGPIDKKILNNTEKYISTGEID